MIDEIDGALGDGKGAVEVLLKMVRTFLPSYHRYFSFTFFGI